MRKLGIILSGMALAAGPGVARPLDAFYGTHRVVVAFGTSVQLDRQAALLEADAAGARERNLVLIEVAPGGKVRVLLGSVSAPSAKALRATYAPQPGAFTAVLIGKDGGEKLRTHDPLTPERLYRVIDAMPMRQQEMRNSGAPPGR